jgi:hypothetical protein
VARPFGDRSPEDYEHLRRDLLTFRNAYIEYLNATLPTVLRGGAPPHNDARQRVQRLAVRAEKAVSATGMSIGLGAPPLFPRPPLVGITSVAFAHEDDLWRGPNFGTGQNQESYELVLDALVQADTLLEDSQESARRRRSHPLYWADRFLRAVLGFPAYLISLVGGFDRRELSAEGARVLWLVSLIADVAGIFGFGRLVGWW